MNGGPGLVHKLPVPEWSPLGHIGSTAPEGFNEEGHPNNLLVHLSTLSTLTCHMFMKMKENKLKKSSIQGYNSKTKTFESRLY